MGRRWTDKEVALARRIINGQNKKIWIIAAEKSEKAETVIEGLTKEDFEEFRRMIEAQPFVQNDPPWWTQAVQWADYGLLWIKGYGWMREEMWECLVRESKEKK
jgi:hypothetical protein